MLIPISDVMPPRVTPWATWTLIALNIAVVVSGAVVVSWLSLAGNVMALWLFAENLEARLGRARFAAVYLLSGAVAAGVAAWATPSSSTTWAQVALTGATAGILGAYLALFTYSRVLVLVYLVVFVDIVEIPATFFLGAWFILQAAASLTPRAIDSMSEGVLFAANLAAFVFGLGVLRALRPRVRWSEPTIIKGVKT